MGHKVHPTGFRLGVVKGWQSRWYAERDYKDMFAEDLLIRKTIQNELTNAAVSKIEIERAAANQVWVAIHTAKPGIVIGRNGEKVEKLKTVLEAKTKKRVRLEIREIRQPELDAYLVGRAIAEQLEKRVSFRRAMKQAVQKSMRANAKGIKIIVGGRLGGAEIARSEKEVEGKIPLHTLRADIDYGLAEAHTTFGVIGIKVWIYKGDILPTKRREMSEVQSEVIAQPAFPSREREGGERREHRERREQGERRRSTEAGGERGPRPQGERPPRPQGERPPRPQGERPPPPQGERPPRPQGERPPRPQGERPARPQGERPARPQGEQPQGERPPRPAGERAPRPARPQGERPARQQGERPPRQQPEQAPEPTINRDTLSGGQVSTTAPEATPPPPPEPTAGPTQSE